MIMRLDLVGVVVLGVSIILSALLVVTVSSINPLQLSHITYRSSESEFVSSYDSSNDQQSTPSLSSSSSSSSEYYQYKNESSSFGDRFLRFVKRMFSFVPSTSFNNDEDDSEYYSGYLSYDDDDDNGDDEDEDDIQSTPEAMRSEIQSSRNYYHRRFARRDLERSSLMDSNISSEFLAETQTFFGQATSSSGSGAGVDSYFMTSSGGSGTGVSSHTSSVVAAASSSSNLSSIVIRLLIGFLLYSITIWTIIGNIIVCVIVLTNRQLKQGGMSNFLIGNLALSDLLLGLTVLPFSATLSTFKTWLFGKVLCDVWLSIDVLCSTASIWALLVISLDRYIATNHPIRYRKQKNSIKMAIIYCTVSWLISIMISLGPLFFISSDEEIAVRTTTLSPSNTESSPYSISFSNHSGASFVSSSSSSSSINGVKPGNGNGGNGGGNGGGGGHVHTSKKSGLRKIENSTDYECVLFQTPSFVFLSSLGSFYLPLLMMIGLYTGVFLKIRQQSKMKFKKKTKDRRRKDITNPNKKKGQQQNNNSSSPTTKHHNNSNQQQTTNVNETTLQSPPPHKKSSSAASENNNVNNNTNNNNTVMSISPKQGGVAASTAAAAATSKGRESIKSIGSGSLRRSPPTPRPLLPGGGGVVRRVSQLKRPTTTAHHQLSSSEARITKTLGIIMGVFVVCWLPFFIVYNVRSQLEDPDSISGITMEFLIWLGYFNSALNPILYAILNANFRNAFRDILACRCCLPGVSHSSLNRKT